MQNTKNQRKYKSRDKACREEIVNTARTYEQCRSNRITVTRTVWAAKKQNEFTPEMQAQLNDLKIQEAYAWNQLIKQIFRSETIRVDDVLYHKSQRDSVNRFNLNEIENYSSQTGHCI